MTSWLQLMTGYSVTSALTPHTITELLGSGAFLSLFLDFYANLAFFLEWIFGIFLMVSPVLFLSALVFLIVQGAVRRLSHL